MMKIKKILSLVLALLMTMTVLSGCANAVNGSNNSKSYEKLLFDTSRIHTIDVTMSDKDRADQLENPKEKTKYKVDVVIDGEKIEDVAFQTKGNSSLYFTADAGKDKFSYGLSFGKYTDGQTYHGLNKLKLSNNFVDGSAMREYMAYWLFRRMDVDAPLASYVWLTVNGEVQGLFTAFEDVDESYLARIASGKGTIYKPEDGNLGLSDEELNNLLEGSSAAHDNGGGADLKYKGDLEENYPDIFENPETKEYENTRSNVIRALKGLSEKEDLDAYLDTDEIIKYFAVHNYLVSYDSYTGPMLHNYCLYEHDGKLAMLPWDYDSSFGSFPMDAKFGNEINSNDVINTGIDSPLGIVADEDRPMWNWILSDETYLNAYHDELSKLVDVIESKEYQKEAQRVYEMILPYIEKDPKAFFTVEEFKKAYETVLKISQLRAESVNKQLTGQLATRSEDQLEKDKVDASQIKIQDMGSIDALYR